MKSHQPIPNKVQQCRAANPKAVPAREKIKAAESANVAAGSGFLSAFNPLTVPVMPAAAAASGGTGLPGALQRGVEALSGLSMAGVRVNYRYHTKHEKAKTLAELPSEKGHAEKRLAQNYTKLSDLVTHAASIKKDFTDWVTATAKKYGGSAELGHMLKDPDSAKRKTWKHVKKHNQGLDYPETPEEWDKLDFSGIFDYLRSTIVVPDLQQLRKLAKELETDQRIKVKRIKDRYFPQGSLPVDDGYRDIQYVLEFHPKGANLPKDFMIELQLNVAAALDLKETLTHKIYEIYRQDAPCETKEQLHELMKKTDEIIKIIRKKCHSVVTL